VTVRKSGNTTSTFNEVDRLQNKQSERFIFSAYASSVGAVLHRPLKAFLSDTPCAAIPVTGGLISQSRENIIFKIESQELLSVGRASATVLAERRDDQYVTLATTTVENLNILDVFTADAVVSRVTSVFPAGDNRLGRLGPDDHKARFFLARSRFDNLKIDRKLIECKLNPTLGSEEGFLINKFDTRHDSLFADGCQEFKIPQFGTIHLGQVDIYSAKIILTMLRVELGCPIVATTTAGTTSTNGTDG